MKKKIYESSFYVLYPFNRTLSIYKIKHKHMKTIKNGEQIKRVKDREAMEMTKHGWSYISKSEWKETRIITTKSKKSKKSNK